MNFKIQLFKRCSSKQNSQRQLLQQESLRSFLRNGVLLLSLLLLPIISHASVSIMPLEAKLQVTRPGARLSNDIEVYNSGDAPIHVTSSIADWSMTVSGQKQFHPAGTEPLSCAPWIQLNPVEFSLLPGKSMRVRYSITPPAVMDEEHHAMLFFTARAVPKPGDNPFALNVQTRLGCKILVTPALKAPLQGKITAMEFPVITTTAANPTAISSKVKITFVNPNPVSVRLMGTVEARNATGELVATSKITPDKALALTGATRELWAQFDKPLPPGTYQIKAAIDYGGKQLVGGVLNTKINAPDTSTVGADVQPVAVAEAKAETGIPLGSR